MNIWGAVEMDGKELTNFLLAIVLGSGGLYALLVFWLAL